MKRFAILHAMLAVLAFHAALGAAEPAALAIQITPRPPWTRSGDRAFALRYSGSGWPTLQITAPWERNTFYRVDFEAKADVAEKFMSLKVKGGRERNYKWRCSDGWSAYRMYIYAGEGGIQSLSLLPEPGPPAAVELRNLAVTPMTEQELQVNLLPDGDFESGSPIASHWLAAYKTEPFPGSIVRNTDYLAGEKNLRIAFAGQEKTRPGLESLFLPMRPGKRYRLSFWARSTGDDATVSAIVDTFALNHAGSHFYQQKRFIADRQWREFSVDVAIPTDTVKYPDLLEETGRIRFHAVNADPQTVLFDDIRFAEQPATP